MNQTEKEKIESEYREIAKKDFEKELLNRIEENNLITA
jgi:ATP-dependent Clp protease ATP-binding subunit ClpA